jgi:aspartyl-tRNA(Asn)/glutamyl-tRNA(Gln) amidotransferase subunit A
LMASPNSVLDRPIREVAAAFRSGESSPREVTRQALERIAATEPAVHAWALVDLERAEQAAAQAESELASGVDRGPLHGIPVGIKDIFDVAGWPTRCGSAARRNAPLAGRDAAAVARLRESGAVLLGKTVTQEFAAGVISPPARNPWHADRIPGGSSGGSAVSVALGTCLGALGSDTGGSIRIPAAACGVVGFKPAYGRFSTQGVFPLSWSLDTVGPLARTVDNTWLMWQSLASGPSPAGLREGLATPEAASFRVGVPRAYFFEWLQPDVRQSVEHAIAVLVELGAVIIDIAWTMAAAARAAAFIINRAETAAVHEETALRNPERFRLYGEDLRLRVAAGRIIPAALHLRAMRVRHQARRSMVSLFAEHRLDAIVVPTLPTTPVTADDLRITGTGLDEAIGAAWTRLTMPFNATGQPVLSVPCGFDRSGLPVGLQIAGEPGREALLFQIGQALEVALSQSEMRPAVLAAAGDPRR